jgi:hypothetical protein
MTELLEESLICEDEDIQEITFPHAKGMKLCEIGSDEYRIDTY